MSNLNHSSLLSSDYYEGEIQRINEEIDEAEAKCGVKALKLLEQAASVALERRFGAAAEAHELWQRAMELPFPCDCSMIAHAVFAQIMEAIHWEASEPHLHAIFKEFHSLLIPKSLLVSLKPDPCHIPDFWVSVEGVKCPVEIKDHPFDDSALKQLQRYMKVYASSKGFAVAPSIHRKTSLPTNVIFVELSPSVIKQCLSSRKNSRQMLLGE